MSQLARSGAGDKRASGVLHWLPRITYTPLKREVIAALGRPWAKPAVGPLLHELHQVDPASDQLHDLRWSIADALERMVDDRVVDEVLAIAADARQTPARNLMTLALARLKRSRERVIPVLLDLLDDPDVCGYAVMALGRLKAVEARANLQCLQPAQNWVHREIEKALARIPAE